MQNIADSISRKEFQELKKFYHPIDDKYLLRSLPNQLSQSEFDKIKEEFSGVDIADFYEKVHNQFVITSQWAPECLELFISKTVGLHGNSVVEKDRSKIIEILKNSENFELQKIEHFSLFNDAQNYFFYSKNHEHVPGLMIIEAARQAMYVHFYEHNGYERGEVTISILDLSCKFPNYTEACYEVDIEVSDLEKIGDSKIKGGKKVANFFQNNNLVAQVILEYVVIPMPIFNRMRNIKIPDNRWFVPLKNIRKKVMLIGDKDIQAHAELQFISVNELKIGFTYNDDLSNHNIHEFRSVMHHCILDLSNDGFLYLPIDAQNSSFDEENNFAIIRFADMDRKKKELLNKILKDYCYFISEKLEQKDTKNELKIQSSTA